MPPLQTFTGLGALALAHLNGKLSQVASNTVTLPPGADGFVGFQVINDVKKGISYNAFGDKIRLVLFQSDLSPHSSWTLKEPMTPCNDPKRDPCLDCAATGLDRPLVKPAEVGPDHPWGPYGKLDADGEWTVSAQDLPKPDWNVRTFEIDALNPLASTYSLAATGLPGEPAVVIAKESMAHLSLAVTNVAVPEELVEAYSQIQTVSLIDGAANMIQLALTFYYDQSGRIVSINGLDAVSDVDGQMAAAIEAATQVHDAAEVSEPISLPIQSSIASDPHAAIEDVLGSDQHPQPELQKLTGSSPKECSSWASVYNWLMLAAYNDKDTDYSLGTVGKTICAGFPTEMFCQKVWNSQFSPAALINPNVNLLGASTTILGALAAAFGNRDNFAVTCTKYHGPAISADDQKKIAEYDAAARKYAKCPWKNRLRRPNVGSGWHEAWVAYQGSITLAHWVLNLQVSAYGLTDGNQVHGGFLTNYLTHESNINTLRSFTHVKKITFLGHSLGGATAQIASHMFKSVYPDVDVDVWTAGSPAPFRTHLGAIGSQHHGAYRNSEKGCGNAAPRWFDTVPFVAVPGRHVPKIEEVWMSRRGWQKCRLGKCNCEFGFNPWDFEHWLSMPSMLDQHSQTTYYERATELF